MAKHAQNTRWKKLLAFASSAFLSVALFVPLSSAPASAAEFDVNFASMSFDEGTQARILYRGYPGSGTTTNIPANASYSGDAGKDVGDRVLYKNVITINGTAIDALIKTVAKSSGTTISDFDDGSAVSNADQLFQTDLSQNGNNQSATFTFTFYVAGSYDPGADTGTTAILKNVLVNSYDLDSSGGSSQYSEMTGFQSYRLSSNTTLSVNSTNGVTRFQDTVTAGYTANTGAYTKGRVQVRFDYLSTFTVSHGVNNQGNAGTSFFALDFGPGISAGTLDATTWLEGSTQVSTVSTQNTSGNRPPTSTDTTRYVSTTSPRVLEVADFGSFADLDSNPFVQVRIDTLPATGALELYTNSAWVSVSATAIISTSDIEAGNLRYTHTSLSNDTISFSVNDGLAYSAATNTITFIPTTQTQTITFNNPGSKTPSQTIASGATADSSLTVTLTSNTPGICSVSGLNIVILANTGNCSITATQAGNSTYAAANSVTQVFSVTNSVSSYTITYDGNNPDTGSVPSNQTGNGSVTLASNSGNLVKNGFTFGGWTIASTTYSAGGAYTLASNVTAVAIWNATVVNQPDPTPVFALTFLAPTANQGTTPPVLVGTAAVVPGNIGNLTRPGFVFKGWSIDGVDYNAGVLVTLTSNRIAYAYWVPKVITFVDTTSGTVVAQAIEGSDEVKLPTADQVTKSGFVLVGWVIDSKTYAPGAVVAIEAVANASAVWSEYLFVPTEEEQPVTEEEVQETVLADTGLSSGLWLTMASLLLAAGVVLMRLSRRRV